MPKKETKTTKTKALETSKPARKVTRPKKPVMTKTRISKTLPVKQTPSKVESAITLRTSPKDVFLHLLMLVMLYLGVISLIALAFAYIDYSFPDTLVSSGSYLLDNVRWQSSMLVVSFPLLLLLAYFVQRDFRNNPKKHELRFYKWLTYLTLFVAALTIVIDLIQLVNHFYSGELTTPFVLKVFSVLVVAGAVFSYYIWDVQTESYKSKIPTRVGWVSSLVVIGMLILGFVLAGSPSHQRDVRMDEQRVNDLMSIQNEVITYWQNKRQLPENLGQLENDLSYFRVPYDPETGNPYEYKVVEALTFELCSEFSLENKVEGDNQIAQPLYNYKYYDSYNWPHQAGKVCFPRTIDPELYPEQE